MEQLSGGGNRSNVNQYATDAFSTTRQDGSENQSDITQVDSLDSPGDDPGANVTQVGNANRSDVTQTISGLATGNLDVTVTQEGNQGFSRIDQTASGDRANNLTASVTQKDGSLVACSEIDQTASAKDTNTVEASVTQGGTFKATDYSKIKQTAGSDGSTVISATVDQWTGSKSEIKQTITASQTIGNLGGDLVTAYVRQETADNESSITQTMNQVRGSGGDSPRNYRASVIQRGGTNNTSIVEQIDVQDPSLINSDDENLIANVTQAGGSNDSEVYQTGRSAQATVSQSGSNQRSIIDQNLDATLNAGTFGGSRVEVYQNGLGNLSDVTQRGNTNQVYIDQDGKNGRVFYTQTIDASRAKGTIFQGTGFSNMYAKVTQSGDRNPPIAGTLDGQNDVDVSQRANNASATVDQGGENNYVNVSQTGDQSLSNIDQAGLNNVALVSQSGDNTTSIITQMTDSSNNTADVWQSANNAWSSVTQSGTGNQAYVTQGVRP